MKFPGWCIGGTYTDMVKSFRKAYEGELVAVGEECWELVDGHIDRIAYGTYLANSLGLRLMTDERTGMPPIVAIDGSLALLCFCLLVLGRMLYSEVCMIG